MITSNLPTRGRRSWTIAAALLLCVFGLAPLAAGDEVSSLSKKLKGAVSIGDSTLISEFITRLGATAEGEAAETILEVLPYITPEDYLDEIVTAFDTIGPKNLDPVIEDFLDARRYDPIAVSTVFYYAEKAPESDIVEGWLLRGIEFENDLVFRNALDVLVKKRSKEAIGKLIELLDDVDPKTPRFYTIKEGLLDLTGYDFDLVDDWKSFWDVNKGSFDPKKVAERDKDATTGVVRKVSDKSSEFFGVEISSQRVMFVIDVSGSMELWDEGKTESGGSADWRQRQRITRVKQELTKAVHKLRRGAKFNIVSFSHEVKEFQKKGLVPATGKYKGRATKWVKGFQPRGATHTDDAMKKAFEDREVDTIVLLTDGAPTKQGVDTRAMMDQILRDVKKRNAIRKVKVYTFGFEGGGMLPPNRQGPGGQRGGAAGGTSEPLVNFLKELAKQNYGKYTPID